MGREVKLSLLADDMILCKENPKDATRICSMIHTYVCASSDPVGMYVITECIF